MMIENILKNIENNASDYIYFMIQKGYSKEKAKEYLLKIIERL